eukprot:s2275_g11.t1
MLDEKDDSELLDSYQASVYRSCVGILLYISSGSSDYVECQCAIRGLSQSMSKPTKQSMECLRYLCIYLLGCTDQCVVLKYTSNQGLLHYNPEDYALEIYSDSDWAKHRTTRRSVSAGYLFLVRSLLYSTSRSQKALALSSCEAEVYAGTSATSDAILMQHCICLCVGPSEIVKMKLALDNSAGRSLFHRAGVGCIRHISLKVLWMQKQVRDGLLAVGPVDTKHNPSDLGTKRMSRDRMLYLMFLCKAYDLSTSEYVGSEVAEKTKQEKMTRKGIKLLTFAGMGSHEAKAIMRVMLRSALSLTPVAASPDSAFEAMEGLSYTSMAVVFLVTGLCIAFGYIAVLRFQLKELQGEKSQNRWNDTLMKVMDLLKSYKKKKPEDEQADPCTAENAEEESPLTDDESEESPGHRSERYRNSSLDEVSDPELWQLYNHGVPAPPDPPTDHRDYADRYIEQIQEETKAVLRRRIRRLEREYQGACDANHIDAMDHLSGLIDECNGLMHSLQLIDEVEYDQDHAKLGALHAIYDVLMDVYARFEQDGISPRNFQPIWKCTTPYDVKILIFNAFNCISVEPDSGFTSNVDEPEIESLLPPDPPDDFVLTEPAPAFEPHSPEHMVIWMIQRLTERLSSVMQSGRAASVLKYVEQRAVMVRICKFCTDRVDNDAKPFRFVKFRRRKLDVNSFSFPCLFQICCNTKCRAKAG